MENKIMSGNELIVQGGLEAGISLYTGYPGSPLADFFNILHDKKKELNERGIRFVIGNSEANAAAMASGAKQAGKDVLVAMKSMGVACCVRCFVCWKLCKPRPSKQRK